MCILPFSPSFFLSFFLFFVPPFLLFQILLSYTCIVYKDRNIRTEVVKKEANSNTDNSVIYFVSYFKNIEKYVNRDNWKWNM